MEKFINDLKENNKIIIKDKEYIVKSKVWYSIEEDETAKYIKCELTDNKVLVIIPDEMIYIGEIIDNMNYERISSDKIKYNDIIFNKTGEGHQYIINIDIILNSV